jgi:hypothetical protein
MDWYRGLCKTNCRKRLRASSIRYDALATYADAIERLVEESQNTQTSTDKTQPDTLQSSQV